MTRRAAALTAALLVLPAVFVMAAEELSLAQLKVRMQALFGQTVPQQWSEKIDGVKTRLNTAGAVIALTFDACGSKGDGYDAALIDFLRKEQVPATLFVTGRWIEKNPAIFAELSRDPLFEIENHGERHVPCSVNGRSVYGITGTADAAGIVDEVETNARRIQTLTGRKPLFYRSGTAYYDEVAAGVVNRLGYRIAGFSVLGDAGCTYSREQVKEALCSAMPGDVVIMHMNHPEKQTAEGVQDAIPELKKRGIGFVRLADVELQ